MLAEISQRAQALPAMCLLTVILTTSKAQRETKFRSMFVPLTPQVLSNHLTLIIFYL